MKETLEAFGLFALLVAVLIGLGWLCSHKCTAGHYEDRFIPAHFETTYIHTGGNPGVMIPITHHVEARTVQDWKCECGGFGFAR